MSRVHDNKFHFIEYKKENVNIIINNNGSDYKITFTYYTSLLHNMLTINNINFSDIFNKFPHFLHDHHAVDFFCDYVRVMTMGVDNKYVLEDMMMAELEGHHAEAHAIPHAVQIMGDAFPAIGIVAAVLGVIITMGSISEPPEILGGLIAGALVGTFLGILISYCFVQPMASSLNNVCTLEGKYLEVIKTGLLAHVSGNAPIISVEFARKIIPSGVRPSFKEIEEAVQKV
jgi:chemotaxis protein MotA